MSDLTNLIRDKYRIRKFLLFSALGLLTIAVSSFLFLPWLFDKPPVSLYEVSQTIFFNLFVVLSGSVAVVLFLVWITPESLREIEFRVVEPADLRRTIEFDLFNDTSEYWYVGHTGRWTRAETLPKIAAQAGSDRYSRSIHIMILDPDDKELCSNYARIDTSIRPADDRKRHSEESIRIECLATILAGIYWNSINPLLNIEIALCRRISMFRLDLSTTAGILTKPYPVEPALYFSAKNFLYSSFKEDAKITKRVSRQLDTQNFDLVDDSITPSWVSNVLERNEISIDLLSQNMDSIIEMVLNPISPYPT